MCISDEVMKLNQLNRCMAPFLHDIIPKKYWSARKLKTNDFITKCLDIKTKTRILTFKLVRSCSRGDVNFHESVYSRCVDIYARKY